MLSFSSVSKMINLVESSELRGKRNASHCSDEFSLALAIVILCQLIHSQCFTDTNGTLKDIISFDFSKDMLLSPIF
jgi:hypothetical protein